MRYESIDPVIIQAMKGRFNMVGDTFRIRHEMLPNGITCTPPEKSPAMTVTRATQGWKWYCHRCARGGFISDENLSPEETKKKLLSVSDIKKQSNEDKKANNNTFILPEDTCINMPLPATIWLRDYLISPSIWTKYGLGWSDAYRRIIMPIREDGKLIAWVGRDVSVMDKADRVSQNCPKYLTIKDSDYNQRVYWKKIDPTDSKLVLVEDILSAIRVREATGYGVVALLQAGVGADLYPDLKEKEVFIWLDNDMKQRSISTVDRLRTFGIDAHHVSSYKDPKCYCDDMINKYIRREI